MLERRQILNRATVPDLQAMLFDQMKSSCFSITTDRSNNQVLEKINLVIEGIFYMHVYIIASTLITIFNTIDMDNGQKRYNLG